MSVKLIFSIQIVNILLDTTSSQYNYQNIPNSLYQNQYQNYYPPQEYDVIEENDYDNAPRGHYRRSRHYKRKPYGSSGGKFPIIADYNNYDKSEQCACTCSRCDDQDPCCKDICTNCNVQDSPQGGQPNLVFVPYPYPLIVTPKVIERPTSSTVTSTTATTSTTTATTSTTTEDSTLISQESRKIKEQPEIETDEKPKYMLTSFRRTKPVWLPKYGIISLPNNLAEKLMSKLRDVKELQNPRT